MHGLRRILPDLTCKELHSSMNDHILDIFWLLMAFCVDLLIFGSLVVEYGTVECLVADLLVGLSR